MTKGIFRGIKRSLTTTLTFASPGLLGSCVFRLAQARVHLMANANRRGHAGPPRPSATGGEVIKFGMPRKDLHVVLDGAERGAVKQ